MPTRDDAPPPALAVCLFRDTLSRASHLKREAQTLADYEYRSSTPPRVAKLIYRIVERCEEEVRSDWEHYRMPDMTPEERLPILSNIQLWDSLLRDTGGRLRYIIGASASRVPIGLSQLLETIIQQLELGDGILLREKWSYNYSVDVNTLENDYYTRLSGVLSTESLIETIGSPDSRSRTYAIGFPAIERQNTLLHCAIGHEIGHIPVERWLVENFDNSKDIAAESWEVARVHLKDLYAETGTSRQGELAVHLEHTRMASRIRRARRRFVQEHGSDLFAIELFGPAALLALANIALSHGLDNQPTLQNDYYPSWRARLRFALDWLKRPTDDPWLRSDASMNPWGAALVEYLDTLNSYIGDTISTQNPEMIDADRLAKRSLEVMAPALIKQIPHPRGEAMTQAYVLAERLATHTPPNDIGSNQLAPTPPYLSAIFNAGWLYTVRNSDQTKQPLDDSEEQSITNRLLLKALSDVIVMRNFKAYCTERGVS